MPTSISYNLTNGRPAGKGPAGEGMPEDTRGFVYTAIIAQASSELAGQIHGAGGYKPFTVSRLIKPLGTGDGAGPRTLRLTALTTKVADAFFTGLAIHLASGQSIRIGNMLLQVDQERGPVTVHSHAEYAELADAGPADLVVLRALSPTTFTDGGRQVPLPVAATCFVSLGRKWNAFAPPDVRIPDAVEGALRESVVVCRHDISTRAVRMRSHVEIGFVGTVGFRLMSRNGELCKWFGALGRFAEYAGLGAHTTLGMGQTAVVQVGID